MDRRAIVAALVISLGSAACRRKGTETSVEARPTPAAEADAGASPSRIVGLCRGTWCFEDPLPTGEELVDVVTSGPSEALIATAGARSLGSSFIRWDGKQFASSDVKEHVTAMVRSSVHDVWATTREGVLLHGDGRSWTTIDVGVTTPLTSIFGLASNAIWAVGDDGVILHFNGATWARAPSPGKERLRVVRGRANNDVWAGGDGVILHFDGVAWTVAQRVVPGAREEKVPTGGFCGTPAAMAHENNAAVTRIHALAVLGPRSVIAAAGRGRVLRFDGTTWHEDDLRSKHVSTLASLWAASTGNTYAVGERAIVRWDGTQWSAETRDESESFTAIRGSDDTNVWIVGAHGTMLRGNGERFERVGGIGTRARVSAAYVGSKDVFAVGADTILRRQPNAWIRAGETTSGARLDSIGGVGDAHIFAFGFQGKGLHWNGTEWSEMYPPPAFPSHVRATAPDDIWTTGFEAAHWDGTSWTRVDAHFQLIDLWTPSRGVAFAIARPRDASGQPRFTGNPVLVRWDGTAFTKLTELPDQVSGIGGVAPNDLYFAGMYDVFHYDGAAVSTAYKDPSRAGYPGDRVVIVRMANDITIGGHGTVLHYDGHAWTREDLPLSTALLAGGPAGVFAFGPSGGVARRRAP